MYLAVILDLFARRAVGYAISRNMDTALCLDTLRMAIVHRRPPVGIIHHSDRGVQYASGDYVKTRLKHGGAVNLSPSRRSILNSGVRKMASLKTLSLTMSSR